MIESASMETLRKRRAGLHIFYGYMEEKNKELDEVFKARPDVILSNALTWREKKGGKGALEEMRKLKTHMGVALSMFSDMRDVAQSPMVQAIVKRLNLERPSKAKYPTVWNINQLLTCIANSEMKHGRLQMRKAMALFVAFSGARMTELAAIQRKDVIDSGEEITVNTTIRKGKKPRTRKITLRTRDGPCCPVKAMREWLQDGECKQRTVEEIWWDFDKKKELGSIGCSKELRKILDQAEVDGCYAGSTVRHAMMTKQRGEGASLEEVNDFTGHAPGSGIVDVFYNKPIARDIGALILKDSEV
ncbi:MAG: hypothetical protein EZS28_031997 [Streblomastix strix]|uniref:Tyr recombinase domain-containing protein n=1 Tax=Streblomastix strix TaxID=222440 RepID=A0A5J4UQ09_9EUKA|nr:MAG: hypothetical protein EZS28_031997 [Streblomastix strix]